MAVYRNISLSFWTDSKVEDTFTPEDKYMYLYLLTNPHTNICGCYEISVKQISRQTGYNDEMVERILDRMEHSHKVVVYCKDTKEMLILNWGRYNWTTSDKLTKPITTAIERIKHPPFQAYVTALYENIECIHTVSIPYPYPMDTTVTVTVTDTVSKTITKGIVKGEQEFDSFWLSYPKKVAKETARKAWAKISPALYSPIMTALEQHKRSAQWLKDGGQFIPNASTWLNNKRWEDDYGSVNGKPADDGGIYDPVTGLTTMPNGCRVLRL